MFTSILILGHTGFIGKNLLGYFEKKFPEVEVIGKSSGDIDLTSDDCTVQLENYLSSNTLLVILSGIKRKQNDSIVDFLTNIKMTGNICRALSKKKAKVIYFSSVVVYGEDIHNVDITEKTHILPRSYYALAKYASEQLLLMEVKNENVKDLLIVRPAIVYGPGDEDDTYGPVRFTGAAVNNNKINLWGDGNEYRDFIYIGDILEIIYRLICRNSTGIFNLAVGKSHSFRDVINIVQTTTGKRLDISNKLRTKEKVDNKFSILKLLNEIGIYSFTPLNKGIERTFHAFLKNNEFES